MRQYNRRFTSSNDILNTLPILLPFFVFSSFKMQFFALTASAFSNVKPNVYQSEATSHNNIGYLVSQALLLHWMGYSGDAKVLGKLQVLGRPIGSARTYCACSRCGWGCLDIFSLVYLFSFLSFLSRPDMTLDVYCGRKTTIQPTNQFFSFSLSGKRPDID